MQNKLIYCLAVVTLLVVGWVYWPIVHANFVWDDWASFHDNSWLTVGDEWKQSIFRGFNSWVYYFRPLVVAFFTLQVRLFDSTPGPMHAVSLGLHLIDTALVAVLAWRCATLSGLEAQQRGWRVLGCMLLYGLHPALIETVSWIGCQFDLIATLWTLLGLIANVTLRRRMVRAAALTFVFFLAACSKESAISLPLLVVLFDWLLFSGRADQGVITSMKTMLARNGLAYVGILLAGIAYLVFRHWAIGPISQLFGDSSMTPLIHGQMIAFTYMHYWGIVLWPSVGMNPIHPVYVGGFAHVTTQSLLMDVATVGLLAWSADAAIRRKSVVACIVLAVTLALFPVLHVFAVEFERSLYHERYATTALAVMCAMLPLLRIPTLDRVPGLQRVAKPALAVLFLAWLISSIATIRMVTPLWASDVNLWRWALAVYPQASQAKDNLLKSYLDIKDYDDYHKLVNRVLADPAPCAGCALFIAKNAVADKDTTLATSALKKAGESPLLIRDQTMSRDYYRLMGEVLIQKGNLTDAEALLQVALQIDPKYPQTKEALERLHALKRPATP